MHIQFIGAMNKKRTERTFWATGRIRKHTFRRVPRFPRSLIGSTEDDWQYRADTYASTYPSRLNLATNDCKSFAVELASTLTGTPIVSLDELTMDIEAKSEGSDVGSGPDILDWS